MPRIICSKDFAAHGLVGEFVQASISYNRSRGTVRGMHFQWPPSSEAKLVRCIRGAIIDVIVDMRPDSPTRLQHVAVELTAANRRSFYVPPYFAHGYQSLEDDTEVFYQVAGSYEPSAERGLRHDDPALGIEWPLPVSVISEKDAAWPLLDENSGVHKEALTGVPM